MLVLGIAIVWVAVAAAIGAVIAAVRGPSGSAGGRELGWRAPDHHGDDPGRPGLPAAPTQLVASSACTAAAVVVLAGLVLSVDLDSAYAVGHARQGSSWWYRLAALWAGAEGSLLVFAALLAVAASGAVVVLGLGRRAMAIAGVIVAGHVLAVAMFANPFERAAGSPVRGGGLTPILEHPAMVWHPPLLYVAMTATVVPFLQAVQGVAVHRSRSVLVAWGLLTVALVTGSHWAYAELGWGGYWGWDPVENTALIVWLALLVCVHAGRTGGGASPVVLGAPFVLALFGSAVTRSGRLSSVHAFADAEVLGWALGALTMVALTAVAAATIGRRAARSVAGAAGLAGSGEGAPPRRHQPRRMLVVAQALAATAAMVVLIGVVAPLAAAALGRSGATIAGSYFARLLAPLAVVAAAGALSVITRRAAVALAHIGFVVLVVGVLATTATTRVTRASIPGDVVTVGDVTVSYDGWAVRDGPRPQTELVRLDLTAIDGEARRSMTPELVSFPLDGVVLPEVATWSTLTRDVQIFVRVVDRRGTATLDIAVRPWISLVWTGAAVMAMGIGVSRRAATAGADVGEPMSGGGVGP